MRNLSNKQKKALFLISLITFIVMFSLSQKVHALTPEITIIHEAATQVTTFEVVTLVQPVPVPEPITIMLFGFGLLCIAGLKRRKNSL